MNANSGSYNYYSSHAKVSFDGFINENYFLKETQEKNLVQNLEITHAITKNPVTYNKEAFIGLFLKSKYDGVGNRRPFNFSIALDVSGSMDQYETRDYKQRITLAKESLIKLVSLMDEENDKISLITFNHQAKKIFGLLKKSEIEKKFLNDLASIRASGGTDLVEALKAAMDNININEKENKENRIIMITDVDYDDHNDNLLKLFKECVEEKNISITIIAISRYSILSLADKVCKFKGCNYFSVTESCELEKFMIKNFNYIFFPIAHETKLTIKSENSNILKCIGGYNELSYDFSHEDGYEAPNPSKEISFDIGSAFSSELIKIDNKIYTKGGLILLKINTDDLNKNEDLKFDFTFEYTSFNGNNSSQNYSYIIENKKEEKNNFFKDNNIKKGISIYYFCVILNYIVEVENKRNKFLNSPKNDLKKLKDLELLETKQAVRDFLNNNFVIEPNKQEMKDNLSNYLKLIEDRYTGYKNIIYDFYGLVKPKPKGFLDFY